MPSRTTFLCACVQVVWSVTVFLVFGTFPSDGLSRPHHPYLPDYQPLQFDHQELHVQRTRTKRSLNPQLAWDFHAYQRHFKLVLEPSTSVFAEDHVVKFGSDPPAPVDTSFVYDGYLEDTPGSHAHISITKGGVSGHIRVPGDTTYHIEPARNHFKDAEFHTIIYPESKMDLDPFRHRRPGPMCGNDKWARNIRNLTVLKEMNAPREAKTESHREHVLDRYRDDSAQRPGGRQRRATDTGNRLDPEKSRCPIHMQADKLMYDYIYEGLGEDAELSKEQRAREEILSLFANHVSSLTDRYKDVKFHGSNQPDPYYEGVNFQIQKTTIITQCVDPTTGVREWDSGYCTGNLDVGHFLELTATENQDEFCLSYFLTYRNFLDGTLGLAYVGRAESSAAGVCGRFTRVRNLDNQIVSVSQNTGIVTLEHFRTRVPLAQSQLTFMHEVGHNFGSEHDTEKTVCAPYGTDYPGAEDGNYIMYPTSSEGNLPNHFLFSSCSKAYIFNVLDTFTPRGDKYSCFTSPNASYCGNTVVEGEEECDCGFEEDCSNVDQCCVPADSTTEKPCTRKDNAVCSPTSGLCCKDDCTFFPNTRLCRAEDECYKSAYCMGNSSVCPDSVNEPNYSKYCHDYTKMCKDGECTGSVCQRVGMEECFPTLEDGASDSEMCHVSCLNATTGTCISTLDPTLFAYVMGDDKDKASPDGTPGVQKPAGSPCNAFLGYCDSESVCFQYDSEGPFKQLVGEIFTVDSWDDVGDWIEDNWYVMLAILAATVIGLVLVMKFCSYNTPPQDPKRARTRDYRERRPNRSAADNPNRGSPAPSSRNAERRNRPTSSQPGNPHSSRQNNGNHVDRPRAPPNAVETGGRPLYSYDNSSFQHDVPCVPNSAHRQVQGAYNLSQPDFPAYVAPAQQQPFFGGAERPPSYRSSEKEHFDNYNGRQGGRY